jgi:hypothetical protein
MMLVRGLLAVLLLLVGVGAVIAALESVAPDPSGRYATMPRTATVQDCAIRSTRPPCLVP